MVEVKEKRIEPDVLDLDVEEKERLVQLQPLEIGITHGSEIDHQHIEIRAKVPEFMDPLPYYKLLNKIISQMREQTTRHLVQKADEPGRNEKLINIVKRIVLRTIVFEQHRMHTLYGHEARGLDEVIVEPQRQEVLFFLEAAERFVNEWRLENV